MIPYNCREVVRGTMLALTITDEANPDFIQVKYYMVLKKLSHYEFRVFDLTDHKKVNIRVPTGWISHEHYKANITRRETWEMQLPAHKVLTFK